MNFDPSNPVTQAQIGAILRWILTVVGAGSAFTGDQVASLAGAVAVLIGLGWSLWQKKRAADDKHSTVETAVAVAVNNPDAAPAVIQAAKTTNAKGLIAKAKAGAF